MSTTLELKLDRSLRGSLLGALGAITTIAIVAIPPGSASAQGAPPAYAELAREGATLAERLCSTCHVVGPKQTAPANAGVPSFRGIANSPGQTSTRIRNVLINPHPPMPNVQLSYPEIERLITYMDSLRSEEAGPPLVPRRPEGWKPEYPDPT